VPPAELAGRGWPVDSEPRSPSPETAAAAAGRSHLSTVRGEPDATEQETASREFGLEVNPAAGERASKRTALGSREPGQTQHGEQVPTERRPTGGPELRQPAASDPRVDDRSPPLTKDPTVELDRNADGGHPAGPAADSALSASTPGEPRSQPPSTEASSDASVRPRVQQGELSVPSVLPFLMLWPLDDFGLLDAIVDVFDEGDLHDLLPVMAYALAQKALPPREAGWLRDPAYDMTAAAFAGLAEPPDGYALEALVETSHRWAPPLHEAVAEAALAALSGTDWLLAVHQGENDFAVATNNACLPVSWRVRLPALVELTRRAGERRLLVHDITDDELETLQFHAAHCEVVGDDAEAVVGLYTTIAALDERLSVPRALARDVEDTCGLLASVALSELARRLWGADRSTDAALALEWVGDLSADVCITRGVVTCQLPMGARSRALGEVIGPSLQCPWMA
jgi:hypothetical protein